MITKTFAFVLLACALAGCNTENRARGAVQAKYPNCEMVSMPERTDEFICRKPDGSIWFIFCGNPFDPNPTSASMVFPAKQ